MKYSRLTNSYARWLFNPAHLPFKSKERYSYVDRHDWAAEPKGGTYSRNCNDIHLDAWHHGVVGYYAPQRMTRTALQLHLDGKCKLHYLSSRKSPVALVCVDVDAHEGQIDAYDAVLLFLRYLPYAYAEPSDNGWHIFFLLHIEYQKRAEVNKLLQELVRQLRIILADAGITSTLEVMGGYTTWEEDAIHRGQTITLPRLPNGERDLERLKSLPVLFWSAFSIIHNDVDVIMAEKQRLGESVERIHKEESRGFGSGHGGYRHEDSTDAFDRMCKACFDFSVIHKRLPNVDELLDAYAALYGEDTGQGWKERRKRARDAIKTLAKSFDESKALEAGFESYKDKLLESVRGYCLDRSCNYDSCVTDADLAIALYAYTRNSFRIADLPHQQFCIDAGAVSIMFKTLKAAGLTDRGGGMKAKVIAWRTILERAGLIECRDARWRFGGSKDGIPKKWVIGKNHWRYPAFQRFSESLTIEAVDYLADNQQAPVVFRNDRQATWESPSIEVLLRTAS